MNLMVSVQIRTHDGGEYGGLVKDGGPAHAEVLSWRENLAGWQVTHPDEYLPFGGYRIRVGDVTGIDVGEPR